MELPRWVTWCVRALLTFPVFALLMTTPGLIVWIDGCVDSHRTFNFFWAFVLKVNCSLFNVFRKTLNCGFLSVKLFVQTFFWSCFHLALSPSYQFKRCSHFLVHIDYKCKENVLYDLLSFHAPNVGPIGCCELRYRQLNLGYFWFTWLHLHVCILCYYFTRKHNFHLPGINIFTVVEESKNYIDVWFTIWPNYFYISLSFLQFEPEMVLHL